MGKKIFIGSSMSTESPWVPNSERPYQISPLEPGEARTKIGIDSTESNGIRYEPKFPHARPSG